MNEKKLVLLAKQGICKNNRTYGRQCAPETEPQSCQNEKQSCSERGAYV